MAVPQKPFLLKRVRRTCGCLAMLTPFYWLRGPGPRCVEYWVLFGTVASIVFYALSFCAKSASFLVLTFSALRILEIVGYQFTETVFGPKLARPIHGSQRSLLLAFLTSSRSCSGSRRTIRS
jgi:hypothetical protein